MNMGQLLHGYVGLGLDKLNVYIKYSMLYMLDLAFTRNSRALFVPRCRAIEPIYAKSSWLALDVDMASLSVNVEMRAR